MKILVVAAHPDDEVLGCGGTVARMTREGHEVFIAVLGEGITSRFAERNTQERDLLKELHEKNREIATMLGAKELFAYSLPDNSFDSVPLLKIVRITEELIGKIHPEVVYTHHGGDLNIDHAITFRAVMTATRPMKGCPVRQIYTFEIPSSTEWAFGKFSDIFDPNTFVDISSTLDLKIQAMKQYESEVRQFPHPRSSKALQATAEKWGSVAGLEAAEAFQLIRKIC
ncbi:PIG-L deacetylase family protein [Desulfococcaceae bacterium HSG9]|nr:PIG-L deacetylase family protein [Desulfococcaceae bacterium HSG9]